MLQSTNSFPYANECPIQAAKHMETKLVKPIHPGDQETCQEWHDRCLKEADAFIMNANQIEEILSIALEE
jgi:hypothetical protein